MTDNLSSSLDWWIAFAELGCWIVIFGIIGEGFELAAKLWKKRKFRLGFGLRFDNKNRFRASWILKKAHPYTLPIEAISFILVVVGLVIEVGASHEAYRISNQQNSIFNKEAGQARALAEAIATTNAQLVASNLVLASKIEELRKANNEQEIKMREAQEGIVDLQVSTLPPKIDQQELASVLTNMVGINLEVNAIPDRDAETQAGFFAVPFHLFNFNINESLVTNVSWYGVHIKYNPSPVTSDDKSKGAAFLLRDKLNSMGFVAICFKGDEPPKTISVWFGERPNPTMAKLLRLNEQIDAATNATEKARLEKKSEEIIAPIHRLTPPPQ